MFTKNLQAKKKIKMENKKIFATEYKNSWYVVIKGKFMALNNYINKPRKVSNQLPAHTS